MDIPFGIQEKPFKQIKKNGKSLKLNIIIDLQNKETWHMLSKAVSEKKTERISTEKTSRTQGKRDILKKHLGLCLLFIR